MICLELFLQALQPFLFCREWICRTMSYQISLAVLFFLQMSLLGLKEIPYVQIPTWYSSMDPRVKLSAILWSLQMPVNVSLSHVIDTMNMSWHLLSLAFVLRLCLLDIG